MPLPCGTRSSRFTCRCSLFLPGYTFRPKPWRELLSGSVSRLLVPYVVLALAWQVPTFLMSGAPLTAATLVTRLQTLVFASGVDIPGLGVAAVGMAWFLAALFTSRLLFSVLVRLFDHRGIGVVWQGVVCAAIAFCGLSVSRLMGVYLPLDLDLSCYIVLLMWIGYTARQRRLEPSASKPLLFIGAGVTWLVLAALSGLELSSRRVDGFVVATVAALAGSYCVCWVSMALEKLKDVPVLGSFEQALVFCGQASLAIFAIHTVDWFIPWQTMPLLMALPVPWLLASIVRCGCDIGLAYVIKKA
ncbi:hypothetical protein DXD49_05240 [Collinsella sp. TM05-38]|nr:hypothetical protein DXD49_05240 [Collinsella sp. TM05-38]